MAVTYILRDTASDLTGGADFSNLISAGAAGTSNPASISIASGVGQEISMAWTLPGVPGTGGATGNYTVEVNVTSANSSIGISIQLHRVNSAGTVQASSGLAAEQSAGSTGVKTFTLNSVSLGTWVAGDRLRIDYRFINNAAHGAQSFSIDRNTVNCEVTTPFTAAPNQGSVSGTFTWTGSATGDNGTQAGSVSGTHTWIGSATGENGEVLTFPEILGYSSGEIDPSNATYALTLPAGVAEGDTLVAFLLQDVNTRTLVTGATGWSAVPGATVPLDGGTDSRGWLFRKVAGASEANPTWTFSGTSGGSWIILRIAGGDETEPIDVAASVATAATTGPYTLASVTTTVANTLLLAFGGTDESGASLTGGHYYALMSGWSRDAAGSFEGPARFVEVGVQYKQQASAGGSGVISLALADTATGAKEQVTHTVAIAPGAAPPAPKQGSVSGTHTWIGSATGVAPVDGVNDGSVSGTHVWTGSATGARMSLGSASGTFTWTGQATGENGEGANLPGSIYGIEPEAAGGWQGPFIDSNGNLYRVCEEQLGDAAGFGNHPMMMKSSDGGETWVRQDTVNSPGYDDGTSGTWNDMESAWLAQDADEESLWLCYMKSQSRWWGIRFWTSDHATTPDTWDQSTFATSSGQDQFGTQASESGIAAIVQSNAIVRAFIRGTPQGGFQAFLHRTRSGGAWDTGSTYITDANINMTRPSAVVADDDTTYLFYKDHSNGQIRYRTVSSTGTVGSSARVDSGGAGTGDAYENNVVVPVFYLDGSTHVAVVGFVNASNQLRTVEVRGGSVGSEQQVSTDAVVVDPGSSDSMGPGAALAVHGTTLYAIWSEATTGDLYYATRPNGGSWSAATLLVETPAASCPWVHANVLTKPGGAQVLAFTYSLSPLDDDSNIEYDELALLAATPEGSASGTHSWTGSATGARPSLGSVSGSHTWTGSATGSRVSSGSVSGTFTWTGAATGSRPAGGSVAGTHTWIGEATGLRPVGGSVSGVHTWTGSATGARPSSGSVSGSFTWTGQATGSRPAEGSVSGTHTWIGAATGEAPTVGVNDGSVSGTHTWTGSATGARPSAGSVSGTHTWTGSASGARASSGSVSGTFTWTGSATGSRPAGGSVSGTHTWTGSATGVAPDVGLSDGSVSGTHTWTGSATGARPSEGSASGSFTWTGSATGARASAGSVAGSHTWTGSATGSAPVVGVEQGSVSGTHTWTGSATGARASAGSVSGSYAFTGTSTGARTPKGSASGSYAYVGSATGTAPTVAPKTGSVAGTHTWTGQATGARVSSGSVTGSVTWTGNATGLYAPLGSVSGVFSWTGSARGSRNPPDYRDVDLCVRLLPERLDAELQPRRLTVVLGSRSISADLGEVPCP